MLLLFFCTTFYIGFDTHADVEDKLNGLFGNVNSALIPFVEEMKTADLWNNVTIIQGSDFGRTLNPNGGDGTDHAWGECFICFCLLTSNYAQYYFNTLRLSSLQGGNYFMLGKFLKIFLESGQMNFFGMLTF